MCHLYVHMLGLLVFTKISFMSHLPLTFIAFIRKQKLPCLSSSSMISLTSLFQSFSSHTSLSCPSQQLLPLYPWPRVTESTHMTWRPWGAVPSCHRTNRGLKTKDVDLCGQKMILVKPNFATTVRKKKIARLTIVAKGKNFLTRICKSNRVSIS